MNEFACSLAATLALAAGGQEPAREQAMETVMQDDAQLLYEPAVARRAVRRMAALGVDRVRLTASWSALAPDTESERRPSFDAADSRDYPDPAFERLDTAVREASEAGMQVMIDIAFFAPRWAVERPSATEGRHVWKPSVQEFARFTRAVAERYDGSFEDPARPEGAHLPAVRLWTTWNEPNHPAFLLPQWERAGTRRVPAAPHHYRDMHNASYDQLKAVDPGNRVLIGGLASFSHPGRRASSNLGPLRFTRELACVDADLRPLRRPECRGFRPLRADGFAHHPYSRDTAPDTRDDTRDRVQIGELDRLTALLAELNAAGRLETPLPLYLTEYGYETKPPDPLGQPPDAHARYLGHATLLAWRSGSVRMFPQFLLEDIGPDLDEPRGTVARWKDFQTGLFNHDGRPKRAVLQGFKLPFHAETIEDENGAIEVVVFGQVRPGEGAQRVEIERLDPTAGWVGEPSLPVVGVRPDESCGEFQSDPQGYYGRRLAARELGTYRGVWRRPDGGTEASPEVTVGLPRPVLGGARGALQPGP